MSNTLHIAPDRKLKKVYLEWASEGTEANIDENRESSQSSLGSDIDSSYGSSGSSQYDGGMDFGNADEDFL